MKLLACLALSLSSLLSTAMADDLDGLYGLGDSRYHRVESELLERGFHVYVMLPDGYSEDSAADYPTLYVLDGGALFPMLTSYYRYLHFGEEVPEIIIVGISYGGADFDNGNRRGTDYTAPSDERTWYGGAEDFQTFLKQTLFPLIETQYRSRAERRMIFGQSIGGQFVLYTAQTEPGLFWGHIASNPALHRNLQYFLDLPKGEAADSRLFVANGTLNDARFQIPALKWIDHWMGIEDKPWQFETVALEGEVHMSTPPAAFRHGLKWLFPDYSVESDE